MRDEAKAYIGLQDKSGQDERLDPLISAASEAVRQRCALNFDQRPYVENRNGNGRRTIFALQPPIATTPAPTATENGIALIVATGYSTNADVIFDPQSGAFYRITGPTIPTGSLLNIPGRWSKGILNVALGYTGGYAPDAATATSSGAPVMPEDLKLVVKYLVANWWQTVDRKEIGIKRRVEGGGSIELLQDLPDYYQHILDIYSRPLRPEL